MTRQLLRPDGTVRDFGAGRLTLADCRDYLGAEKFHVWSLPGPCLMLMSRDAEAHRMPLNGQAMVLLGEMQPGCTDRVFGEVIVLPMSDLSK